MSEAFQSTSSAPTEAVALPVFSEAHEEGERVTRAPALRKAALAVGGFAMFAAAAVLLTPSSGASSRIAAFASKTMMPPPPTKALASSSVSNVVTLIGGDGPGFVDGCGSAAKVNKPTGVTRGSDANTFLFVDQGNHAIRKLTIVKTTVPQDSYIGCVQTIAGGGTDTEALSGFKDADGLEARFSSPAGLAIGLDGTIFVADQGNHAVRGISPDDLNVHTLVGNGTQGNMDGQALDVRLDNPTGVAVIENANLMVLTEGGGHTIRAVEMSTKRARTVLGHYGEAGFSDGSHVSALFDTPASIELSPDCTNFDISFVMTDSGNNAVRTVAVDSNDVWTVQTMTGGRNSGYRDGDPISSAMSSPNDIAFDSTGNLLISDTGNNVIRYFDKSTGTTSTLAGTQTTWLNPENDATVAPPTAGAYLDATGEGCGGAAMFDTPTGLATNTDDDTIVISDQANHAIRLIVWDPVAAAQTTAH